MEAEVINIAFHIFGTDLTRATQDFSVFILNNSSGSGTQLSVLLPSYIHGGVLYSC